MNFNKIAIGIIIAMLLVNPVIFSQIQAQGSDEVLNSIQNIKTKVTEIPILAGFEDTSLLENEVDAIDKEFSILETKLSKEDPSRENISTEFNESVKQWNILKNTISFIHLDEKDKEKADSALQYFQDKEEELRRLSENIVNEFSSLDNSYSRHKEIAKNIQESINNISTISKSDQINNYAGIKNNQIIIQSSVKTLLQIPLEDNESLQIEQISPIPRENSKSLNEFEFVWESVQLRLISIESISALNIEIQDGITTKSNTQDLISSIEKLEKSWKAESQTGNSQQTIFILIGVIIAGMIVIGLVCKKSRSKQIEPVVEPESIPEIIIVALHDNGKSTHQQIYDEIIKYLPSTQRETMRARLSELRRKCMISRDDDGLWTLEEKGEKEYESLKKIVKTVQVESKTEQYHGLEEGIKLFTSGKYKDASKFFEKVLNNDPNNAGALYYNARSQSHLYNHDSALDNFEKLLNLEPNHVEARYYQGIELSIIGKHAESVNVFDAVLSVKNDHKNALLNKGRSLVILNKNDEALSCYTKVLEKEQNDTEALYLKGVALQKEHQETEAINCYEKIIRNQSNHKLAHYNLGLCFTEIGEYEKAIQSFNNVIELDKEHKESIYQKGLVLLGMGEFFESEKIFDRVLELDSHHQGALRHKGFVLSVLDRYDESLRFFDKAMQSNPLDSQTLSFKTYSLMKLEKFKDALECCKKLIDLEPRNGNAYYNLAKIQALQNESSDALRYLRQAIQINSKYEKMAGTESIFKNIL